MKKLLSIIAFMIAVSAFSQKKDDSKAKIYNKDLKRANAYFKRAQYAKAIPLYEKVNINNQTNQVIENIATSYYNTGDVKTSARFYGYLVNRKRNNRTYQNIFKYVQALKASGKYNDAHSVMREYLIEHNDTDALKALDHAIKTLDNIKAIGNRYQLENLPINTENSEFGMVKYNDFLVLTAAKNNSQNLNYGWNAQPFLDIYKIHKDSVTVAETKPRSISNQVNTKLHEGTATFSKDGKVMYFTRNNYDKNKEKKDEKYVTHLKLYKAELIEGVWANIEPLPFNSDNFSVEHPAISHDGKRLYFSSDMPGSLGEFDVFYVDIHTDGTYGAPVNLGPKINTKHREQFPFIATNGDLYFASDGHLGFGNLDVFWSKLNDNTFQTPENLGLPLNSSYDDFAFFADNTLKSGYISSNRPKGKGSDDIYSFKETKPLIIEDCKQFIEGIITDRDTKSPILNGTVTFTIISEENKALMARYVTKLDGTFNTTSSCEITVHIKAEAEGYKSAERTISISNQRNTRYDASLALISLASIEKKKAEEALKKLKEQQEKEQQKQAEERIAQLKKEEETKKQIETIIAKEPHIKINDNKVIIETEAINFDYKLWYIRRDVKPVLQRIVNLMKKYPNMEIEIGAHTDIRGDKAYNKELSQKRANSTKDYLVSKGIKASRLTATGYGESQPIKYCETEESCSEEDHEINRRSEFVVKKVQ